MTATLALVFIIGLCIGSFLNVIILRSLSGESIVLPASKCPKCQEKLKWWHNIPVISYILLRGKCGFCKEPIGFQYPAVELITGIAFALIFLKSRFLLMPAYLLYAWAVVSLLIVIAGTDIREKVVFSKHTYALTALGLTWALVWTVIGLLQFGSFHEAVKTLSGIILYIPLVSSLLGIIAGVIIMEAAARLGYLIAGTRAFGEGDTFIAAALGAVCGWRFLLVILALSLIIQMIFTLPVFTKKLLVRKDYKTLITSGLFFIYAIGFFLTQRHGMLDNTWVYAAAAVILSAMGLYLCKLIISGIKQNPDSLTYLPFGPAMAVAGLLVLIL
ncbi:MAG: prepilin peptidase [Heliobacteriaceae bacterium]|jgi:leader peptidase (prepilin peptidase)/N-methyltransferase|nr:prepilin peptidase [Heliobacteriaceae bacterium]